MNFSKISCLAVLVKGKRRSLALLYVLILGSAAMESIGIASFYPITKMLQNANEVKHFQEKVVTWAPALEFLNQEQFLFYFLLIVAALFAHLLSVCSACGLPLAWKQNHQFLQLSLY